MASLGRQSNLSDFVQFFRQPMPERTFKPQLVDKTFGFIQRLGSNFTTCENLTKVLLHFSFGKQNITPKENKSNLGCYSKSRG